MFAVVAWLHAGVLARSLARLFGSLLASLLARSLVCLLACVLVCFLECLFACVFTCLLACLLAYLLVRLLAHLPANSLFDWNACILAARLLACLFVCVRLLACLLACLLAYQLTSPLAHLLSRLQAYLLTLVLLGSFARRLACCQRKWLYFRSEHKGGNLVWQPSVITTMEGQVNKPSGWQRDINDLSPHLPFAPMIHVASGKPLIQNYS